MTILELLSLAGMIVGPLGLFLFGLLKWGFGGEKKALQQSDIINTERSNKNAADIAALNVRMSELEVELAKLALELAKLYVTREQFIPFASMTDRRLELLNSNLHELIGLVKALQGTTNQTNP